MAEVASLVRAGEEHDCPVLWECSTRHPEEVLPAAIPDALQVAHLYFDGLDGVRIDSVEDALRLRDDAHIADLRGEIFGAIRLIETGSATKKELQKRIDRANKIVAALGRSDRASRLKAILGLPARLVPILGDVLTIESLGKEIAGHRWRWALVSNARTRTFRRHGASPPTSPPAAAP